MKKFEGIIPEGYHFYQGFLRRNPSQTYKGRKGKRNFATRVSVKAQRKKAKPTLQECPNCEKREVLQGPRWCDCFPSAPFKMGSVGNRQAAKMAVDAVKTLTQTKNPVK